MHSFDLVAGAPGVFACNIADVPLCEHRVQIWICTEQAVLQVAVGSLPGCKTEVLAAFEAFIEERSSHGIYLEVGASNDWWMRW